MAPMLNNTAGPSSEDATPSLSVNLYNHIASLQALNAAMHSALQFEFGYIVLLRTIPTDCSLLKILNKLVESNYKI